jgi:hypothetical protein
MSEIPLNLLRIPSVVGVTFALLILGLLVQKEIARALGRPGWTRSATNPATARQWRLVENWLLAVLFVLYGLVLLARLLSFFP